MGRQGDTRHVRRLCEAGGRGMVRRQVQVWVGGEKEEEKDNAAPPLFFFLRRERMREVELLAPSFQLRVT